MADAVLVVVLVARPAATRRWHASAHVVRLDGAAAVTAITRLGVAVIAGLEHRVDQAIAAGGIGAGRAAARASVVLLTLLARQGIGDAVTAALPAAVGTAAVGTRGGVIAQAFVALLIGGLDAVATGGGQVDGWPLQENPVSIVQLGEQPSPASRLWSSQASSCANSQSPQGE